MKKQRRKVTISDSIDQIALDGALETFLAAPHATLMYQDELMLLLEVGYLGGRPSVRVDPKDPRRTLTSIVTTFRREVERDQKAFRKSDLTKSFKKVAKHGKVAAAEIKRLPHEANKIIVKPRTPDDFSLNENRQRLSDEHGALLEAIGESNFIQLYRPDLKDGEFLFELGQILDNLARLLEITALDIENLDVGGASNTYRMFETPPNFELLNNTHMLFVAAGKTAGPNTDDVFDRVTTLLRTAATGQADMPFTSQLITYFKEWKPYEASWIALLKVLRDLGYSRNHDINRIVDRINRGDHEVLDNDLLTDSKAQILIQIFNDRCKTFLQNKSEFEKSLQPQAY